ncbi:arabinofuranosidase catalytic domain-containing protein [Hydrotalea flava]|uniref:arabinofuranosidase catalytic domain-containing protein n=1 Tax=Hydrotalea flava TaxID=714549 RepID=UPI000A87F1D9|nr:arabinofuranosidase catalytic domain-containing protein [Hydrotalea flava]
MKKIVQIFGAVFLLLSSGNLVAQNTLDKAGLTSATPAALAYSVRQLSSGYAGKALQVRRSSDNTTQDIGFTSNGDLDTAALKTFVGSGNGYVTTWYDQSGNARNATQTTLSQQPAIVLSGVVQRANTQPAVVFDGLSQTMASGAFTLNQAFTRNSVTQFLSNKTTLHYFNNAGGNPNTGLMTFTNNNASMYAGNTGGPTQSFATGSQYVLSEEFNGANSYLAVNGASSATSNPGTTGLNGIQIASYNGASYYSNIAVSEITIFPQALSTSDRQNIENNQKNYYLTTPGNILLNVATGAAAYSVRLLSTTYSGKALQVRRSSDNTTQDIGFTSNGDLDTAALKTFVGSGNGYVTTWYDQSGNARNATQTTLSQQPAIVLSGVVQRANTQPAVVFDGLSQTMASGAFTLNQAFTRNSVTQFLSNKTTLHYFNNAGGNPNTGLMTFTNNNASMYAGNTGGPTQSFATGSQYVLSEEFNGANSYLAVNGASSATSNPGTTGLNGIQIASYNGASYYSNIAVSEITIFPQALSTSDRQTIENNQGAYYGITTVGTTTWTGAINNDWANAGNWSNGVPTATVSATIPNVTPNPFPVITAASQANSLTVNTGASLTLNNSLQLAGNLVNNGTLTNNNTLGIAGNLSNNNNIGGTLILNGSTAQNINGTGTYSNLTLNNSGGSIITLNYNIRITGLLTVTAGTLNLNNSDITLASSSIANTAQVGPLNGSIIYPGTGRFVVERIIAKADGSQSVVAYNNVTASVLSDLSIWANWQESATTANYNPNNGYGTQITGEYGASQGNDATTGIDYTNVSGGTQSMWTWDITGQKYVTVLNTKTPTLKPYLGYVMYVIPRNINLYTVAQGSPIYFQQTILRSRGKLLTGNFTINSGVGSTYQLGGTTAYTDNGYKLAGAASVAIVNDSIYSLVGNPYAASFDFTQAMANSGTSGLVTTQYSFYDGAIAQYVTWDATTGPSVAGSAANKYIQPGQSFFIQNDLTNSTRQFIVTEANKNTNAANLTGIFAQAAPMSKLYLSLLNAGGQVRDGALLAQRSDFSNQSLIGEDARKFRNPAENMALSANGRNWSIQKIQSLSAKDTLPITFWNLAIGKPYTLVANGWALPQGWAIYDALTAATYMLTADSLQIQFTPTTDTASYLHRFSIIRVQAVPAGNSGITLLVHSLNGTYQLMGKAAATLASTGPDYTFERSSDSLHFEAIGQLNGVHDTVFAYTDAAPTGTNWYRIRGFAADRTVYSNTVAVSNYQQGMSIQAYPNPSNGESTALRTRNLPAGVYRVTLYNSNGQLVYSNTLNIAGGNTAQVLQWNSRLATGTYYVQLQSAHDARLRFTQTILIQNH